MRVISVPQGLRASALLVFTSIPLAVLQTMLTRKVSWWQLPYQKLAISAATALVLSSMIAWLLLRGRRFALSAAWALGFAWTLASFWMSVRMGQASLAYFALVLSIFWLILVVRTRIELERSFFDPRMAWYQGLPLPIPAVACEAGAQEFRVARLDREGAFIFAPIAEIPAELAQVGLRHPLVFRFRDREVRCEGAPIGVIERNGSVRGISFQFRGMSPDELKRLGDFIETLKGEGYVD